MFGMVPSKKNEGPFLDNEIKANSTKNVSFWGIGENLLGKILKHNILPNNFLYAIFMTELRFDMIGWIFVIFIH